MKKLLIFCLLTIPISLFATDKQSLNGSWSFRTDPYNQGEKQGWFQKDVKLAAWDNMDVPGNWDLENEYADYVGDAWYSRNFFANKDWENKLVRIVFESVYNDSKVWINGREIGENHLGFLSFQFDISTFLNFGEENRVTVKANNLFKRGAIWNWGGIRRPVWLEITEKVRMDYQHITAIPDLDKKTASVTVVVAVTNTTQKEVSVILNFQLHKKGEMLGSKTRSVTIPANSSEFPVEVSMNLSSSEVKLWHYDFPELYQSSASLSLDKKEVQSITDNFGIRKLEVVGKKLLLNGEEIRPVGFNLVPEDRATGNTLPFSRIKEDVDMLKELGVNFCRISHLPLPKEYLDYLDEKGIMTFEEVSLWGKDKWVDPDHPMPKEWLIRMIKERYNHPSIVGWSVGNEIGFLDRNPKVMEYVKGAIAMTKELDPNRLAVYVTHSTDKQEVDPVMHSDLNMLNKYGKWGEAAQKSWEKHRKPIFMSEYGKQLNHEDPNLSHIDAAEMLDQLRNREYVLGASLWTFNDYRSFWHHAIPSKKTSPSQNRTYGIVTTFRQKKRSYYTYRKEHSPLKDLTIEQANKNSNKLSIKITPRAKFDIPANPLRGFSLKLSALDADFEEKEISKTSLKNIFPGDEAFETKLNLPKGNHKGVKVELLDPQGYSLYDITKYFNAPEQAKIIHTNTAVQGVRITFKKAKGAEEHFVRYQYEGKIFYSDTTINNFINITDNQIKLKEKWEYELIAINGAGESAPTDKITLVKDEDELPPVIWHAAKNGEDLVLGFSVDPYDYLYELEYGYDSKNYTEKITFKNKGVARVPDVQSDKPLYFRMRCRKQWGFASEWAQEVKVE